MWCQSCFAGLLGWDTVYKDYLSSLMWHIGSFWTLSVRTLNTDYFFKIIPIKPHILFSRFGTGWCKYALLEITLAQIKEPRMKWDNVLGSYRWFRGTSTVVSQAKTHPVYAAVAISNWLKNIFCQLKPRASTFSTKITISNRPPCHCQWPWVLTELLNSKFQNTQVENCSSKRFYCHTWSVSSFSKNKTEQIPWRKTPPSFLWSYGFAGI